MTAKEYATGLRSLADWYEVHRDAELPYEAQRIQYITLEKDQTAALMREFGGHWDKKAQGGLLYLTREFGPLSLQIVVDQSAVCTKRVVGKKLIPAQPAQPEREEEIVEWDCAPLFEARP